MGSDNLLDGRAEHLLYGIANILSHQHSSALRIDHFPLLVHHIIVLQNLAAGFIVALLNALLRFFNLPRHHAVFQRDILSARNLFNDHADALSAKQAHEVVLQGDIEAGSARVPLAAASAAQLIVYAAGFMPLCADDVKPSRRNHFLVLGVRLFFIPLIELMIERPRLQHLLILGIQVHGSGVDKILIIPLTAHFALGHIIRIAAQQNIRAAPCHVRRNRDGSIFSCLCDDHGLFFMVFGVEHLVPNALALEHATQNLAVFHRNRAHKYGPPGLMHLADFLDNRLKLRPDCGQNNIVLILADHGAVRRDLNNRQVVDAFKFCFLRLSGSRHA